MTGNYILKELCRYNIDTYADVVYRNALLYPDQEAFLYRLERITFSEFNARVNSLIHTLWDMEVKKGDVLGVLSLNCLEYMEMLCIKDLPSKPECPKCGTLALAVLREGEDQIQSIIEKRSNKLTEGERKVWRQALTTAKLVSKYGKPAAVALAGRRLTVSDVEEVLLEEARLSNHFYELLVDAERKALKRRFW